MADDKLNEFNNGASFGAGRGAYGEMGNQIYKQEQALKRKSLEVVPAPRRNSRPASPNIFDKIARILSFLMLLIGAGFGYSVSAQSSGYGPLIGLMVGAAIGFAAPRFALGLLRGTVALTVALFKGSIALAIILGIFYLAYRFYT